MYNIPKLKCLNINLLVFSRIWKHINNLSGTWFKPRLCSIYTGYNPPEHFVEDTYKVNLGNNFCVI